MAVKEGVTRSSNMFRTLDVTHKSKNYQNENVQGNVITETTLESERFAGTFSNHLGVNLSNGVSIETAITVYYSMASHQEFGKLFVQTAKWLEKLQAENRPKVAESENGSANIE